MERGEIERGELGHGELERGELRRCELKSGELDKGNFQCKHKTRADSFSKASALKQTTTSFLPSDECPTVHPPSFSANNRCVYSRWQILNRQTFKALPA